MTGILDFLKEYKDAFSSLSAIFAVLIFAFAVYQYQRGESWKKNEFIAKLYKDLVDDPACQRAMWLLDWGDRRINFGSETSPNLHICTEPILLAALRKHDESGFDELEMAIRDTFDRFFMYIEQFERAMQNNLVDPARVYPYFAYWIDLLNGKRHLSAALRQRVAEYVEHYGFRDVRRFLDRWPG
ncbi:MAG: hypothetical protein WCE79_17530 [Xanthobacteraceae bacterium]